MYDAVFESHTSPCQLCDAAARAGASADLQRCGGGRSWVPSVDSPGESAAADAADIRILEELFANPLPHTRCSRLSQTGMQRLLAHRALHP